MQYQESKPFGRLANYIKCYWSIEYQNSGPSEPEPIVPDGCIEIVFDLADRFRQFNPDGSTEIQPDVLIAGQLRSSVLVGPTGNVSLFGIRFLPTGAARFFRGQVPELSDRITPLDLVWGVCVKTVADQLAGAGSFLEKVAIVEELLNARLALVDDMEPTVEQAVRLILAGNGLMPIPAIARSAGISDRGLVRKFRQLIGISPKSYSRIVRFQRVLRSFEDDPLIEVPDVAIKYGYYDQSHLINDFRQYAGLTPTEFRARNNKITEALLAND